jgi:peptidyl-prolyl cis-trans isomerase D
MLQTIRDRLTGWVAFFIIAAIAVALVISFGKMKTDVANENFAARVNGEDIAVVDFRQIYQRRLLQEQERSRLEFTPAATKALQKNVLDQMILTRVVSQFVREQGYHVDDKSLGEAIKKLPVFQVDGKFSEASYEASLAAQGISLTRFQEDQRTSMEIEQLQNSLIASSFYTPAEYRRFVMLEGEQRTASYVVVDPQKLLATVQIDEPELKAYYDAHPDKFESPESVALDYVEADVAGLGQEPEVDDAKLRATYDDNPVRFRTPEQRRSRHILIAINADRDAVKAEQLARDLRARLAKGEDFAALAKQYSNDTGSAASGGDLDWAGRGTFVGPFEKTLFDLKTGETSEPTRTEFGYHVIQLQEVRGGGIRPFEEVREELRKELGSHDAQDRYAALTEKMDDAALQNPNSLDAVAKTTGLAVKHIDKFTRAGGGPFGANRALIEAAFSHAVLEEGENSPLIEIGEGRTAVVRVAEHRKVRLRPIEEAKAEVETALRLEKATVLATIRGQEILKRLKAGGDFAALAREFGVQVVTSQPLNRGSTEIPADLLIAIYRAPKPVSAPVYAGVALDSDGYAVYRLDAVSAGRPEDVPREQRDARKNNLAQQSAASETAALAADLRRHASIVVAPNLFDQTE